MLKWLVFLGSLAATALVLGYLLLPQEAEHYGRGYAVAALRDLVSAEEKVHGATGHYGADLAAFGIATVPTLHIRILAASSVGWRAEATIEEVPGGLCTVWVGTPPPVEAHPVGDEGWPRCSGFPRSGESRLQRWWRLRHEG